MKDLLARLESFPLSLNALLCRWGVAAIFWRSGQTKVHGFFEIDPSTYDLFRDEYKVPVLPPETAALLATISEHLFSALLVIGLASRLSALALFGMTMVIEIFVYPDSWPDHLLWSSALLLVLFQGPGKYSIDHLVRTRFLR
jgi:putative oxidoreductase